MLALVEPDGHYVGLVKEYIRRHQHGVVHKPHIDIIRMPARFILELRHTLHFADVSKGVQRPAQLCMAGHVRLDVQRALFGINSAGNKGRLWRAYPPLQNNSYIRSDIQPSLSAC